MSPLHLAAWSGKVEVARLLVEAGAHVNANAENGDTPLILACQHGNSDVVCTGKKHRKLFACVYHKSSTILSKRPLHVYTTQNRRLCVMRIQSHLYLKSFTPLHIRNLQTAKSVLKHVMFVVFTTSPSESRVLQYFCCVFVTS